LLSKKRLKLQKQFKLRFQLRKSGSGFRNGGDEIIEMDRMHKLIAGYMVASVQTSAHVQSFIEVDVTNIVKWREKNWLLRKRR
jgi:pyruvate/2-oxoglutarate dehydrogenase complex dihydrolipoamide acyltransferase (E2) component